MKKGIINKHMRLVSNSHKVIFWDRPDLRNMSFEEFKRYIETLRQEGRTFELSSIIRRYVERGNSLEGMLLFTPEEIEIALKTIQASKRALMFCNPIRLRAWKRAVESMKKMRKENVA